MSSIDSEVKHIQRILKSKYLPVGIKIIKNSSYRWDASFQAVKGDKRFCYYVLRAAQGGTFVMTEESDLACYTPFICLGFDEPKYTDLQPRINPANTKAVLIAPLNKFESPVDSIVFVVNAKQAMLLTGALRRTTKKKIEASLSATMAVCGEIVAHTVKNKTPNISLLCGGARLFSGYEDDVLVFGVPFHFFDELYEALKTIEELQVLELEMKKAEVN